MALVLDTGSIYALLDQEDEAHTACRRLIEESNELLVIPAPVLVEVDFLARARMSPGVSVAFLDDIIGCAYTVEDLLPDDYLRIRSICHRYDDNNIGFVDAAVLAVVERLNEPKLATLDQRHFRILRPRHVDALMLLPE